MIFEYILSGLGMTRIITNNFRKGVDNIRVSQEYLDHVNAQGEYLLGGLFNAYVEAGFAPVIEKDYRKHFSAVHVDSGGLQVITRGLPITDALKKQIYHVQGTYGDIAMCFDEIPLHVDQSNSTKSNRTNMDNKTYVTSEMEAKARATGRNVNDQLKAFRDMKSPTKVMLIVQGNNRFDFAKWAELAYEEVEDDLKEGVHGIAMADTCIGNGILETVEMCAAIPRMNIPERIKKNIHFLGVGSLSRLVPVIELSRGGLFPDDSHISFDSTSHTCSLVLGKYTTPRGGITKFGKTASRHNIKFFRQVYDEIAKYYEHDVSFEDYVKYVVDNITTSTHLGDYTNYPLAILANLTYWFTAMISAENFMHNVVSCQKDQQYYYGVMSKKNLKGIKPLMLLAKVNTIDDFEQWFATCSHYVESVRIKRVDYLDQAAYTTTVTLDMFDELETA